MGQRNYWWVNQGQTWEEERRGSYLWSPKRARDGSPRAEYDRMEQVQPGDVIVHYAGEVRAVSVATSAGYSCDQPKELRRQDLWSDDGWRVDVTVRELRRPLSRDRVAAGWWDEEPFNRVKEVNQGYLYPLTQEFAESILTRPEVTLPQGATAEHSQTAGRNPPTSGLAGRLARHFQQAGIVCQTREINRPHQSPLRIDMVVPSHEFMVIEAASPKSTDIRTVVAQLGDARPILPDFLRSIVVGDNPGHSSRRLLNAFDISTFVPSERSWSVSGPVRDRLRRHPSTRVSDR